MTDISKFAGSGGEARAAKLTKEERRESARIAAEARWKKAKELKAAELKKVFGRTP